MSRASSFRSRYSNRLLVEDAAEPEEQRIAPLPPAPLAIIDGTPGDDVLNDTPGDDVINGYDGNDTIRVSGGSDIVDGGTGNDLLIIDYSALTNEAVTAGAMSTLPNGISGSYQAAGGPSVAFSGINTFDLRTGGGNDSVRRNSADDIISTGAGDDVILQAEGIFIGRSRIDGGPGFDGAEFNWSDLIAGQNVSLNLNNEAGVTLFAGTATERYLRGLEYVFVGSTGAGNDTIVLNSGAAAVALNQQFSTNAGSDRVTVYSGTSYLTTGSFNIDLGTDGENDTLIADVRPRNR